MCLYQAPQPQLLLRALLLLLMGLRLRTVKSQRILHQLRAQKKPTATWGQPLCLDLLEKDREFLKLSKGSVRKALSATL